MVREQTGRIRDRVRRRHDFEVPRRAEASGARGVRDFAHDVSALLRFCGRGGGMERIDGAVRLRSEFGHQLRIVGLQRCNPFGGLHDLSERVVIQSVGGGGTDFPADGDTDADVHVLIVARCRDLIDGEAGVAARRTAEGDAAAVGLRKSDNAPGE